MLCAEVIRNPLVGNAIVAAAPSRPVNDSQGTVSTARAGPDVAAIATSATQQGNAHNLIAEPP